MNAPRYGISLRVEYKIRNFISTSNHVLSCLSYRPKAFYRREKSTLLMNENERVDIPNKARLRAQDGHMR